MDGWVERAEEITVKQSHERPDGSAWYTLAPDYLFGENFADGYDTANDVVNAWMLSPAHMENILNPYYTGGNIQIVKVNDRCYWVNEFYEDWSIITKEGAKNGILFFYLQNAKQFRNSQKNQLSMHIIYKRMKNCGGFHLYGKFYK